MNAIGKFGGKATQTFILPKVQHNTNAINKMFSTNEPFNNGDGFVLIVWTKIIAIAGVLL